MGSLPSPIPVVIIGGGPVGLCLALDLGRRGIHSTLIERQPGTATELQAKASVIDERTMEFCRLLGVRDGIAHAGYPADLPGDTVFCTALSGGHYIGRLSMDSAQTRVRPPQAAEMLRRCPQIWFDPVFADAVAKQGMTEVRYSTELVECIQHEEAGYVLCRVRNLADGSTEELRAQYVVACDGAGSEVRRSLGIAFEGKDLGYAISAIVRVDLARHHTFTPGAERFLFLGPEGTWGNFTTIDGRTLWRFSIVGGKEKRDLKTLDMDSLLCKAFGEDAGKVEYEILQVVQWRRSQCTADRYHAGRIFLAGDAAHTMSPTGGHGLNTGIGDAMTLSWMLQAMLEGWGGAGLAEAYTAERRPVAQRNGAGSTRNFAIWTDKAGRDRVLEDGVEADEQRKVLGQSMAASMRQEFQSLGLALGYDYAQSPLVVGDGSAPPPNEPDVYIPSARPGHRAPHHWLAEDKSTLDLFGGGFVLLRLGSEVERDEEITEVAEKIHLPLEIVTLRDPEVIRIYERRLVLVRPDGMVAWRGDELPENLNTLLDSVRGAATAVKSLDCPSTE
ncbi:FAD binding domain-containing protein [Aspergillus homomorphus CBS 101889]|uniref:FAD binding domain-containing protein n=1 Tax=Aspergillus homomorphus (strain CBS 101889) TaxID=1450537 RepID=A0A395IA05_ASPHC|nr:FAD binding domain-containing protein [Aspergillus homomorphus CBS 101889]RAL16795.1 FAD binding domain-containing protein [Aspergillus homomorphus CBS 101889]